MSMKKRQGLGKGLESLIPTSIDDNDSDSGAVQIRAADIVPSLNQPRKFFDDERINALAESIKVHGIIQPIIVAREGDIYRIIVGERRWRAARAAELETIPCIVRDFQGAGELEIALIENIQREDLNAIEEAEAYNRLIDEYGFTQEQLSEKLGKSRPYIANMLRLLGLSDREKSFLVHGDITAGHARALLSVNDTSGREKCLDIIISNDLSVRETEQLVKKLNSSTDDDSNPVSKKKVSDANIEYIENGLKEKLATMVKIITGKKKGKIIIEYYSNEDLDRLINIFGYNDI